MGTSKYLLKNVKEAGQRSVLTNGLAMNQSMIEQLQEANVDTVKVTFFSTAKEQLYWQGITEQQYLRIRNNIENAAKNGLQVVVNNVLWKANIESVIETARQSYDMGVQKVVFLRYMEKEVNENIIMDKDMDQVIEQVEKAKLGKSPRLQISFSFGGPSFYGKTMDTIMAKINNRDSGEWVNSTYLCPAIDQDYLCISARDQKAYWCYWLKNDPLGEIGYVDEEGKVNITRNIDLRPKTLVDNLEGKCASTNCDYSTVCLGGCRKTAVIASGWKGKPNIYAAMDICTTKVYERVFGK